MNLSRRKYAILAGISLLIMAITAGFAFGYVQNSLIVTEDSGQTLSNLNDNTALFGSAVAGWIIILITDVIVTLCLYKYFESVHNSVSSITGLARLIYSGVLAFAIDYLIKIWQGIHTPGPEANEIMESLIAFQTYWSLGLIIFGIHLVGLGYLSLRSEEVPKWMGYLLYVAGFSYTFIHGAKALLPAAADTINMAEKILGLPMALAEIMLAFWLLAKGGKH